MNYTQHPLSAAFPAMQADEYQSLVDSINLIGVQNPITLLDGMVIDGWHRYTAAQSLGMDCPTVELDNTDPRDFVMAQNKARRHITQAQLVACASAVYRWRPQGGDQTALSAVCSTSKEVSEKTGASVRTVEQYRQVERKASPEVIEAVKRGEVGLPKAAAIAKLPMAEQAAALHKPTPKPALQEPKLDDFALTDADLIEEMQETQAENKQLLERVELMSSDNKAAEIDKLLTRIAGLEGRINQLMMQVKTSSDGEKYHATVIHKLRKLLGVDGHKEIIAAVTALVADRRLAA